MTVVPSKEGEVEALACPDSGDSPATRPDRDRRVPAGLVLAGFMVIAAVLRAIGLNTGLWQDEIFAVVKTVRPPLMEILTQYPADTHHPLYSALAHISVRLFGEHPWSVRLPALLFGVFTIPALYLLGRRVGPVREALLACAVLTVSFHHVWFSQNARGYTALAIFAVLCVYVLLRGIDDGRRRWFALYALFAGLGAYTHLTFIFMAIAHAAVCAWLTFAPPERRRITDWRLPLLAFGGGAAVTILLYLPMLDQVLWWFLYRPSNLLGVSTPSWAVVEGIRVLALGLGIHPVALLVGAAIFAAGALSFWRQQPVALALFLSPAITTLAGALLARGTLYPRFFFFLAGFLLLIAVRGAFVTGAFVTRIVSRSRELRYASATGYAMVGLIILASARSLGYNYRFPKQDFEGAIAYVESERSGDEAVMVAGAYYPYPNYFGRDWPQVASAGHLEEVRRAGVPVWVVYMQPRYIEKGAPGLVAAVEDACSMRRRFDGTVGGGDIIVCRVLPY